MKGIKKTVPVKQTAEKTEEKAVVESAADRLKFNKELFKNSVVYNIKTLYRIWTRQHLSRCSRRYPWR